jgi:hypothetical protein
LAHDRCGSGPLGRAVERELAEVAGLAERRVTAPESVDAARHLQHSRVVHDHGTGPQALDGTVEEERQRRGAGPMVEEVGIAEVGEAAERVLVVGVAGRWRVAQPVVLDHPRLVLCVLGLGHRRRPVAVVEGVRVLEAPFGWCPEHVRVVHGGGG